MPIKDKEKLREYQRELMRKRRQGLTNKDVSPSVLDPDNSVNPVSPKTAMLDLGLTVRPVRPEKEMLDLVSPKDKVLVPNVSPSEFVKPCSNCSELATKNSKLQWELDTCAKRHTIPKEADFIDLMWDRRYKKFVFYACADPCWNGKYCNNCSSLEQQLINLFKRKQNK